MRSRKHKQYQFCVVETWLGPVAYVAYADKLTAVAVRAGLEDLADDKGGTAMTTDNGWLRVSKENPARFVASRRASRTCRTA